MIAVSQRDLPYLVLTVDPLLQAYRTDSVAGVEQSCPKPDGDILCDQVSYAPFLSFEPASAAAPGTTGGSDDDGGGGGLLVVLIAAVVLVVGVGAFVVIRRRRADREAIEV